MIPRMDEDDGTEISDDLPLTPLARRIIGRIKVMDLPEHEE